MKKFLIPLYVILGIVLSVLICYFVNFCASLRLKSYIKTFDKIEYSSQIAPTIEEEGFYTFRTDDDFRIMNITDIHLGSGIFSVKKDLKTIYEVMTQVSVEKPDLVILDGDMIFAVPAIHFHGGGTLDNKMASDVVMSMFDRLGVYYTVAFGNHDAESVNYYNKMSLYETYINRDKHPYSIVDSNYNFKTPDPSSKDNGHGYGVTNQFVLVKSNEGLIKKAVVILDSNSYVDDSIFSAIGSKYDTIHDSEVNWAYNTLKSLGNDIKSLLFFHIPNEDFEIAYKELKNNNFNDTQDTIYIEGYYGEEYDAELDSKIWFGGCFNGVAIGEKDSLFEVLGPDGLGSMEACFVGHDHVNNAVVNYKGVVLAYNLTSDNCSYEGLRYNAKQRGSTIITIHNDSSFDYVQKFAYDESNGYNLDKDKYFIQELDSFFTNEVEPLK